MRRFIAGLSVGAEFTIVFLGAFGLFIFSTLVALLARDHQVAASEGDLRLLVVIEVVLFAVLATFMRVRGWTLARVGFHPSLKETLQGLAVAVVSYCVWALVWLAFTSVVPQAARPAVSFGTLAPQLATIIVASIVNAIYEETFVSGYLMTVIKEHSTAWTAINISVGVRLLYHLYQGIPAVTDVVPIGLIFAYWYARQGSLWPLIVAHALIDIFGLLSYLGRG